MNGFLSTLAAGLLLLVGGYFTVRFRAFYFAHPVKTFRAMPMQSGARQMLLSLGGTVGVGNISGVAVALSIGGAGAVFWMWVGAFISMALKYAEILLGMLTRKNGAGGAPYYIKEAIGSLAAVLFAVFLLLDCVMMGGVIQSSAIAEAAQTAFGMSPLATGIFVSLLAAAVFFFGIDLFGLSAYVVPAMSGGYVLAALAVILCNLGGLPAVLRAIFTDAFTPTAASGGVLGFLVGPALRQGIVKGLFSNEAGCGTAPSAHIASKETVPARQGLFGIFEVFFDTVVMCSLTAFVILLTLGVPTQSGGGVAICARAFATLFGTAAPGTLCVFVFLFAFSAIVAFGYYGMQSLDFFRASTRIKDVFLILYCLSLFFGALAAPKAIWEIADAVICVMLLINTSAVFVSRKKILQSHASSLPCLKGGGPRSGGGIHAQIGKYAQRASKTRSFSSSGTKNAIPMSERDKKSGEIS